MELEEACATLADKSLIYVMWTGGRPMASQMTRLMATQNFRSGRKILFFDTTQKRKKYDEKLDLKEITDLTIRVSDEGFDKVESNIGSDFFTSNTFEGKIKSMLSSYDKVFICSDNQNSVAGLIALKPFNPELVVLSRLRNTKKSIIEKIISIHPIRILFYD